MTQQQIEQAIRSKSIVEFNHGGHWRVVEPHVLGVSGGSVQLLGYQIGGSSSSGGIPEWRRFELSRILGLSITNDTFPGRRPFPSGRHSSWDRQILVVDT
jgi:predicted DNA-binding transcriptional regulator YafY